MNALNFELHPEAIAESVEASLWYETRSEDAAERFVVELEEAEEQIRQSPQMWARYLHGTRRYVLKTFPFSFVYSIEDTKIIGVAVAHHSRKPGYWKDRLKD